MDTSCVSGQCERKGGADRNRRGGTGKAGRRGGGGGEAGGGRVVELCGERGGGGGGERGGEGVDGGVALEERGQRRTAGVEEEEKRLARFLIISGQLPPGERSSRSLPTPPTPPHPPSLSCFLSPRAKFLPCWSSCLSKSPCTQQPEAENEGGTLASAVRTIPSVLLAGESSAGVRSS